MVTIYHCDPFIDSLRLVRVDILTKMLPYFVRTSSSGTAFPRAPSMKSRVLSLPPPSRAATLVLRRPKGNFHNGVFLSGSGCDGLFRLKYAVPIAAASKMLIR